jgi:hypothetical protein
MGRIDQQPSRTSLGAAGRMALKNKTTRIVWAVTAKKETYRPQVPAAQR